MFSSMNSMSGSKLLATSIDVLLKVKTVDAYYEQKICVWTNSGPRHSQNPCKKRLSSNVAENHVSNAIHPINTLATGKRTHLYLESEPAQNSCTKNQGQK